MSAIRNMNALIAALAAGQQFSCFKLVDLVNSGGLSGQPAWASTWKKEGKPGAGSTPATGAGAVPTSATAGAIPFTNMTTGYLGLFAPFSIGGLTAGSSCHLLLVDRLVHTSGLDANSTSLQTFNSTAITRPDALGADVEMFIEIYTAVGATARTMTVVYKNQANASQTTTVTVGGTGARLADTMIPVVLADGDTGVRSVVSVQFGTGTGTSGDFGITLVRRVALGLLTNYDAAPASAFEIGMPRVYDDACLNLMVMHDNATTTDLHMGATLKLVS